MKRALLLIFCLLAACMADDQRENMATAEQALACPAGQTVATCHTGPAGYNPVPDDQEPPPSIEVCGDPAQEWSHEGAAMAWWKAGSAFDDDPAGPWDVYATIDDGNPLTADPPNAICGGRTPIIEGIVDASPLGEDGTPVPVPLPVKLPWKCIVYGFYVWSGGLPIHTQSAMLVYAPTLKQAEHEAGDRFLSTAPDYGSVAITGVSCDLAKIKCHSGYGCVPDAYWDPGDLIP
jgi:hypothetical protein